MNFIKKLILTILGFFIGTLVLLIIISLFTEPVIASDGTSELPQWSIFIIFIYWIAMVIGIWNKQIKTTLKNISRLNYVALNDVKGEDSLIKVNNEELIKSINIIDPLLYEVTNYIIETGRASTSNIQRRFGLGYNRAAKFIDILEQCGIIGESKNSIPRPILSKDLSLIKKYSTKEVLVKNQYDENYDRLELIIKDPVLFSNDHQFYKILEYVITNREFNVDDIQNVFNLNFGITSNYIQTLKLLQVLDEDMEFILSDSETYDSITDYIKYAYLSNVDYVSSMSLDMLKNGLEFESFIGNLLTKNNYHDVIVTQASNDYGIDVTATKEGIKYAIQCKYYTSPVGNTSIQEVVAGKNHYNAHIGVVATNNYFTKNAIELAKSNNIILWDRDKILSMIKQ